jgi:hypothetical protein
MIAVFCYYQIVKRRNYQGRIHIRHAYAEGTVELLRHHHQA